jgi:cytochrome P450
MRVDNALPVGALARHLKRAPLQALNLLAEAEPGTYVLDGLNPQCVLITDPPLVEEVLSDPERRFRKAALPPRLRWLVGDGTAASGLSQSFENDWDVLRWSKRQAILPLLAPPSAQSVQDSVSEFELKPGSAFDAFGLLYERFFVLAWRLLFGREPSPNGLRACRCLRRSAFAVSATLRAPSLRWTPYLDRSLEADPAWWRLLPGGPRATLLARRRSLDVLMREMLSDAPRGDTQIDLALAIQTWSYKQNTIEPKVATRFACVGVLLASFENSASVATWLLWLLARHPEWQERLASVPASEPAWNACLDEALRLFPPVWSLARQARREFTYAERSFPAKTIFLVSPWVQGRLSEWWDEPNAFHPQRWQEMEPTPGLFLPFGLGQRACPGASFARQEIKSVLSCILERYRFEIAVERMPPVPLFGLTQRPRSRVWLRAWPR